MKSEFESREAFECIFGDEGEIDLSKDEKGEYSFQPSRFAYSFFFLAWQYRQTDVDELQKRVDAAYDALTELKEKSEALHHRWQIFSDSVALAEAEMIDMCVKDLEQALKGGSDEIQNR